WLDGAELRREHEVGHERQHVRRLVRRGAKEVVGVGELGLEPDDAADRTERDAVVGVLVLAVGDLGTTGVTAEVVSDERTDESLRAGLACAAEEDNEGGQNGNPPTADG